jgi:tRNA-2-methylthio-N6-dimethylallyladenosine synthase
MADILDEVRVAFAAGAREVTLVGQTVNAYRDRASGADFSDLLEIVAALDGLERLTFVTSHPKDFTEKLARTLGDGSAGEPAPASPGAIRLG